MKLVEKCEAIAICPEKLGGLPTPRNPMEIVGGSGEDVLDGKAKVVDSQGNDMTAEMIKGAQETVRVANEWGIRDALLAPKSPSCGCGKIYDGTFSGKLKMGDGVTAALLKRSGIRVVVEEKI